MPRKFRAPKDRQDAPLPDSIRDVLLTGELRPISDRPPEYNALLRWTEPLGDWWAAYADLLTTEWIAAHPGTRPYAWWSFTAPEPRRRLGGIGEPCEGTKFGIPSWWLPPLSPHDPPVFESESAYLDRHGLLTAGERRRLTADANGT